MDWKILIGVVLFILSFSIYQKCKSDDSASYDDVLEQQRLLRQNEFEQKKSEQNQLKTSSLEEQSRNQRGQRAEEKLVTLENSLFKAQITNRGAALKSWELKDEQYLEIPRNWATGEKAENEPLTPINLVTTNPGEKYWTIYPLRLHFYQGLDGMLPDADYELVKSDEKHALFKYEQPGQPVVIYKNFQIADEGEPYQLWLTIRIANTSQRAVSFRPGLVQSGYQPASEAKSGLFSPQPNLQTGLCFSQGSLYAEPWEKIKTPYVNTQVSFTGVANNYFLSAIIPYGDFPTSCRISAEPNRVIRADLQWGELDVNPGDSIILQVQNYIGPKKYQTLQQVGGKLEKSVDYGILAPICRILLWLLFFFQNYVGNWGLAIILLTITVKLVLIPLTNKSFKSSNAMKALKPEMDKINEKFKDDPQEKQKAIMAMYKQKGINPLGGCLPMLLQMPIWFALFRTLRSSPELYRAPFFGWITDLSDADPYFITPLIMGVTMFIQQRMMPMGTDNAQMKMMMYLMPIMFTVMMVFLPSGLTLYILVNTVLSILHQWVLKKRSEG